MQSRHIKLLVTFSLISALLAGCGTQSAIQEAEWKLTPYSIRDSSANREGWKSEIVAFIFENTGTAWGCINNTEIQGTATTVDGFDYPFQMVMFLNFCLPPGFRAIKADSAGHMSPFEAFADIPAASTIKTIKLPFQVINMEDIIDLNDIVFPTSLPRENFKSFPITEEFTDSHKTSYVLVTSSEGYKINITLESYNKGYDTIANDVKDRCFSIDGGGEILDVGNQILTNTIPPGRTIEAGSLLIKTQSPKNAKLVCMVQKNSEQTPRENEYDIEIYNLD